MQTPQHIHNANILAQAMTQQNVATKAQVVSSALNDFLNLPYDQFIEPIDTMALYKAQEVLAKFNARKMYEELATQLV